MRILEYDREKAVAYAREWAFKRNPAYYNFDQLGGDCTNFASQCLFAGADVMNYTPDTGWFYSSLKNRAAAWAGVEYFYRFLKENAERPIGSGAGPFATEIPLSEIEIGDFIQFGRRTGDFYHTPVVVGFSRGVPLLATHTFDAFNRPLTTYHFEEIRCLHILGVRKL